MKYLRSLSFVVPIFNNEKTLVAQIKECENILKKRCKQYEMILCDDGSFDRTGKLLEKYYGKRKNVTILTHKKNQGIAPTLRDLYKSAKLDYIFLFSVDGDWNPNDINRMIDLLIDKRADLVLGVRTQTNYPLYRKIVSFFYNFLPLLLFGVKTFDAGSIKIIKKSVYRTIPLISKGVFFEAELIIKAAKQGYKIVQVKNIHYHKQVPHSGKGGKFSSVLESLSDMLHLRLVGL